MRRGKWPAEPDSVELDILAAEVHLKTGLWTENIAAEEPYPGPLTEVVVAAAFAHAGVLLGLTDLGDSIKRANLTRSALLWACNAAITHRDHERDPWDLRELAEEMAASALWSALTLLMGVP